MQAVILAAGRGIRLRPLTNNTPKCLIKIGPETILEHQIRALTKCSMHDITVITGFCAEKIRDVIGDKVCYIHNNRFDETNSLYSLWLARDVIERGLILLNADVLYDQAIFEKLVYSDYPNVLAVDSRKKLSDGEMNVKINKRKIILDLSKQIKAKHADAESAQIIKLCKKGTDIFLEYVDKSISTGEINQFPAYALQKMLGVCNIYALDVDGLPWVEIDEPKDILWAKEVFAYV